MEDPARHYFTGNLLGVIVGPTQAGTPNVTNSLRRAPPASGRYSLRASWDWLRPMPYRGQRIRYLFYSDNSHYATLEWNPQLPGGLFSGKDGATNLFWQVRDTPNDDVGTLSLGFDPATRQITVLMGTRDDFINPPTPIYSTFPVSFTPTAIGLDPVGSLGDTILVDQATLFSWPFLSPPRLKSIVANESNKTITVNWDPSPTPSPTLKHVVKLTGNLSSPALPLATTKFTFFGAPCSDPSSPTYITVTDIVPNDLVAIPDMPGAFTGPWHIGEFSPEGMNETLSCVGYLNQGIGTWWDDIYDHTNEDPIFGARTIKQKGCALTATAMLLNYLGIVQEDGSFWDPTFLNEYLSREPDGFSDANIWWSGGVARLMGVPWKSFESDEAGVNAELFAGRPVLMDVGGHWVLATGRVFRNGHWTYAINDPGHTDRHYLDHFAYGNYFVKGVLFDWSGPGPALVASANWGGVWFDGHGATSLEVTDPLGRSSDGSTGTTIPNVVHADGTGLFDDAGPDSLGAREPDFKSLWLPGAHGGPYQVALSGEPGSTVTILAFVLDSLGGGRPPLHNDVALGPDGLGSVVVTVPGGGVTAVEGARQAQLSLRVRGNPGHGSVRVEFSLPSDAFVSIVAFDIQGRRRGTIAEGHHAAGTHQVIWSDGRGRSAELLVVEMRALGRRLTRKVVLQP